MSHDSEPTHYTDATAQHQQSVAMNPFEPIPFEYALQQQHVPRYVGQAQHCDRVNVKLKLMEDSSAARGIAERTGLV